MIKGIDAVATDLVRALNRIEDQGVEWTESRFGVYLRVLQGLVSAPAPDLVRQYGEDGCRKLLFEACSQSLQLTIAAPAAKK